MAKTPFLPLKRFAEMGCTMLPYPATLLFRLARTTALALECLEAGEPMSKSTSVDMDHFEDIVADMPRWNAIDARYSDSRE